jgi:hypothetical protein
MAFTRANSYDPHDPITLNQRVQGSSPCAPTNKIWHFERTKSASDDLMSSRGNLWGNVSAAWCDELEPHTGKGAGGQERRLTLGVQMKRFWLEMFNQTYLSRPETG